MKTVLIIIGFLIVVLGGCNNNASENNTVKSTNKDSLITTLTDLSSTTDIKMLLCQNWENKDDAEEIALSGSGAGLDMPYRGISFFNDATLVENPRDKIRFGKWSLSEDKKLIRITLNNGTSANYKIAAIGAKQMILMNTANQTKTIYRADAKVQDTLTDDPFYAANNLWRIKPKQQENDAAIKLRAEQCVLFYAKYLADNAGRGGNIISFAGLPSCFKWYKGGVSVVAKNKLELKWIECFYNKAQALKAHSMIENIIGKKYKWNKTETNWVKQSADVVKQMYDTLKLL